MQGLPQQGARAIHRHEGLSLRFRWEYGKKVSIHGIISLKEVVMIMAKKDKLSEENIRAYLEAYDDFNKIRKSLGIKGNPKVDSQVSEAIAANKIGFEITHKGYLDGKLGSNTYEVKGTGYNNNKARFSQNRATKVIWVKLLSKDTYEIREINDPKSVYDDALKSSVGIVDLSKYEYTVIK